MTVLSKNVVHVIGISGNTIEPGTYQYFQNCGLICGSKKQLELVKNVDDQESKPIRTIPITPLEAAFQEIEEAVKEKDVVVLASGDPLFFGVGRTIIEKMGTEQVRIHPGVSYMQLAFAHFGIPWEDVNWLSFHGRQMKNFLPELLNNTKLCIFTDPVNSPIRIAEQIVAKYPGQCNGDIEMLVAARLGTPDELLMRGTPKKILDLDTIQSPNIVIVLNKAREKSQASFFGLKENEIIHSRGLITKSEVRAASLHSLRLPSEGIFWDIGGGSGSISLEAARLQPGLEIFCVEEKGEQVHNIESNIIKYTTSNIHLKAEKASLVIDSLPAPDRVFIGGSGGELENIIDTVCKKLQPEGIVVVNCVLEKTAALAPKLLFERGLRVECSTISVNRTSYPDNTKTEFNPITIVKGYRDRIDGE